MRIPESKIAEITAAADIVRVISEYVSLKRAGKDFRGVCPFHGDKDPSFYVSPAKSIFYCFGCGVGGSVFNFVMKMENVPFVEAATMLAQKVGVHLVMDASARQVDHHKERLLDALNAAQEFFVAQMGETPAAVEYLHDRGLTASHLEKFLFGFAPDSWDGLVRRFKQVGIDPSGPVAAGLIKLRPTGGHYDVFRSRITIPIRDLAGRIIAFGGRIFGEGDPKYLNSPESSVFRKKATLYGLFEGRDAIKREDRVILTEGYFDRISLAAHGIENAVAGMGTAVGPEQIRLLKRFTERVTLIFDGDEAGVRALKRSIPLFLSEGIEPTCLVLTLEKDPDEAVRGRGPDALRAEIEAAPSVLDKFLEMIQRDYDLATMKGRNSALEECIPVLGRIADSKERDYLIERFSSALRIREQRVRAILIRSPRQREPQTQQSQKRSLFEFPGDERNVVRGMLLHAGVIHQVLESGTLSEIEDPVLRELAELMIEFDTRTGGFDPKNFAGSLEREDLASLVAGWLNPRPEEDDLRPDADGEKAVHEAIDSLRRRALMRRKAEIQEKMKNCPPCEDEYNTLAGELWAIAQNLRK